VIVMGVEFVNDVAAGSRGLLGLVAAAAPEGRAFTVGTGSGLGLLDFGSSCRAPAAEPAASKAIKQPSATSQRRPGAVFREGDGLSMSCLL
jgi:hypothetical protein